MGSFWSAPQEREERSLLALLNEDLVDWQAVCNRLRHEPEEAAAFCHSIDPSPLTRSLQHHNPPLHAVQALLGAYEEAVYYTDRNEMTPLHAAVRGTTVMLEEEKAAIVQLLLRANSQALSQKDVQGRLPIHFARTLSDVTEILVRAYPEGARHEDQKGKLPLHYCVEHAMGRSPPSENEDHNNDNETAPTLAATNPKVVKALVEAGLSLNLPCGGVLCKDKEGTTPLDLICQEIQACVEQPESQEQQTCPDQLWAILCILVETAFSHTQKKAPEQPFQLVHAVVSLFCPACVVGQALLRHPEQAGERDHLGRTPLTIATTSIEKMEPAVICELLKCNKDAARMTDAEGRLPIDLAAEQGVCYNEELWEALVKAEPRAVDTRDLRDKNFPFMTAAIGQKSNVNTVYRLLRTKPHVVNYFNLN